MKGKCLCGAIEVTANVAPEVHACHCGMCRRWGGGPAFVVEAKEGGVEFMGKPATYRSSDWAERGFCSQCGSHLFYRLVETDQYMLSAGLFQDEDGLRLAAQIFIDEKPGFYDFANDTPKQTGAEVFAQFEQQG